MPLLRNTKLFFAVSISFLPTIFFKKQNSTESISPGRGEVNLCVISGKILLEKSCNSKNYREVTFTIMPLLRNTKLIFSISTSFLPTIFFKKQNSTESISPGRGEVNLLLEKSCNSKNYRNITFTICLSAMNRPRMAGQKLSNTFRKILLKKSCNSKNYRDVIFTIGLSSSVQLRT